MERAGIQEEEQSEVIVASWVAPFETHCRSSPIIRAVPAVRRDVSVPLALRDPAPSFRQFVVGQDSTQDAYSRRKLSRFSVIRCISVDRDFDLILREAYE